MNAVLDLEGLSLDRLLGHEWLVTNRLGGFASSTIPALNTRKYHGLLVAAMAPPVRRMVILSRVEEIVCVDGRRDDLACNEYPGAIFPQGHLRLRAFNADPYPRWAYQGQGWTIEKSLRLVKGSNTVVLRYTLLAGDKPVELELRPQFALRPMHELMYQWNGPLRAEAKSKHQWRIAPTCRTPEAFFAADGKFTAEALWYLNTIYRSERERGYAGLEDVWSPGIVHWTIAPGQTVTFACSTDPIRWPLMLEGNQSRRVPPPPVARENEDENLEVLLRATDEFHIEGAHGSLAVSQYPWSAPSHRDMLIGFTGSFLIPKRNTEAKSVLQSYLSKIDAGLIPQDLREDGTTVPTRAADTSLWLIQAVWDYFRYTKDESAVRSWLDAIVGIVSSYRHGTRLGIRADQQGLLSSHAPGTATSWMDAKVGDWVITARAGRPVELNALWYNAICIASNLSTRFGHSERADELNTLAAMVKASFNKRFWNEAERCCFDVIYDHGQDPSIRPNQILAASLPFAVLDESRRAVMLERVRDELLTPMGLRSLSKRDPSYQGHYSGNVVARDRAQHQGCVYPWLLGAYCDARYRIDGRVDPSIVQNPIDHIRNNLHLCELFDGDSPHNPGGAIACLRNSAEVLRAYVERVLDQNPPIPQPATPAITEPAPPTGIKANT